MKLLHSHVTFANFLNLPMPQFLISEMGIMRGYASRAIVRIKRINCQAKETPLHALPYCANVAWDDYK